MKEKSTEWWQMSSQHLFSHSFVRASLNMDSVWSRAGASGTPQTAQAAQAGQSRCDGCLSVFLLSSLDSLHCLPPFPPAFISSFLTFLSSDMCVCLSDDKVLGAWPVWSCFSLLFLHLSCLSICLFLVIWLCDSDYRNLKWPPAYPKP